MTTPYRIVDLLSYTNLAGGLPSGNEIAEISNGGHGSFQVPLSVLAFSRVPRSIMAPGTFSIGVGDYGDVLVSATGAVVLNLPNSISRAGVPVSIVDVGGSPHITINPSGIQLIIGQSSLSLTTPYGGYTLWPNPAGGWYQK